MSDDLVARFVPVALERIERVEQDWNRLVQGGASRDLPVELRRELHTLKGEAQVVGLNEVSLVCRKLEELTARAEKLAFRVPQDLDLLVMMAIRFIALLARKQAGHQLAGLDLDGFVRQVDDVLAEVREPSAPAAAGAPRAAIAPDSPSSDRLSAAARRRLGRAAVLAFVESVRATGSAREHLREVWQTLSHELSALGSVAVAPRVRQHAQRALERALETGRQIDVRIDIPAHLRVSPEVADALDRALLRLLGNAVDHGIEPATARRSSGKRVPGTVAVRCEEGAGEGEVTLVVEDDGAGVDLAALARRAALERLSNGPRELGRSELLELLFRGAGLGAVRSALTDVGGAVAIWTEEGQGTTFRLRAPRAAGKLAVHSFTACGGLDLALAVPAAWTVAPIDGTPVAVDPLEALVPDSEPRSPTGGFALRLTRGRFDLCWRAVGPVRHATAERIGAPVDDQPAEVVRIDGREALLLRPELS